MTDKPREAESPDDGLHDADGNAMTPAWELGQTPSPARFWEVTLGLDKWNANEQALVRADDRLQAYQEAIAEELAQSGRVHVLALQPWLNRLGGATASAVAWTEYLVRALIEEGCMTLQPGAVPSLGPTLSDKVDEQRRRDVKDALHALWHQAIPLVAAAGRFTLEVARTQDGAAEIRVRTTAGTLNAPRVQFLSDDTVVAEVVGRALHGQCVISISDDTLHGALGKRATHLRLIV